MLFHHLICILPFSHFLVMTTSTPEKADGLKALENAIERIRETITKLGGVFTVNMAVSICSFNNLIHKYYRFAKLNFFTIDSLKW